MGLPAIGNEWTLFLDRDGVINREKHLGYINTWEEFIFEEGAKEAIHIFASRFKYIFVVSNQRGVGKGITRPENLVTIHQNMLGAIESAGGRVDHIYFCPDLEIDSPNRKPNPGMGLQAKKDFQDIDFTHSIMVGNKLSDMEFGRNIGAKTVFVLTTNPDTDTADPRIDTAYPSLIDFAKSL